MKALALPFMAVAFIGLTACSGPSYKSFNYQFQAPPEYTDLTAQHKTIAIQTHGTDLSPQLTAYKQPLPPLQWIEQYQQADLLVDLKVKDTDIFKDVVTENEDETINSSGKKERTKTYVYDGVIQTNFTVKVTDNKLHKPVATLESKYKTDISGSPQRSEKTAEQSLALTGHAKKAESRNDAMANIEEQLTQLLEANFLEHSKTVTFEIPQSDDDEPRLATAYSIITTKVNVEGAREALGIYQAIGTENKDKKGEENKSLNQGVHAGMAACYYILGNVAEYERHQALAKRDSWLKGAATTYSNF